MNITAMLLGAEPLVQAVMLLLVAASVLCWSLAIIKVYEITVGTRTLNALIARIRAAGELAELQAVPGSVGDMVEAACEEIEKSRLNIGRGHVDGACSRIGDRLLRVEAQAFAHMRRGLPVFASIGSVGPFGTVWGIMYSFASIAGAQSTGLAVVAPGISEALLATALGLGAAIPATVLYNFLLRQLAGYKLVLETAASLMLGVAARDIEAMAIHHPVRMSA